MAGFLYVSSSAVRALSAFAMLGPRGAEYAALKSPTRLSLIVRFRFKVFLSSAHMAHLHLNPQFCNFSWRFLYPVVSGCLYQKVNSSPAEMSRVARTICISPMKLRRTLL